MATKYWRPLAEPVSQVYTWTFGGTWVAGETITVNCFKRFAKLTLGTDVTVADVVRAVSAMINAKAVNSTKTTATADETYSIGGQQIPEFTEFVATYTATVLTITTTAGIHTIDSTGTQAISLSTTSGSGTIGSATSVQAATGPTFYNNANNWSNGSVPGNNDTTIFDRGGDCSDGLINTATAVNLIRKNTFQGNIGRPHVHPTLGYVDYRKLSLNQPNASSQNQTVTIGELGSPVTPKGITHLNLGGTAGTTTVVNINDSPPASPTLGESVKIDGGNSVQFNMRSAGSCGAGLDSTATATSLNNTYQTNGLLRIGSNVTFLAGFEFSQTGGVCWADTNPHSELLHVKGGTYNQISGTIPDGCFVYKQGVLTLLGGNAIGDFLLYSESTLNVSTAGSYAITGSVTQKAGAKINDPFNLLNPSGNVVITPI